MKSNEILSKSINWGSRNGSISDSFWPKTQRIAVAGTNFPRQSWILSGASRPIHVWSALASSSLPPPRGPPPCKCLIILSNSWIFTSWTGLDRFRFPLMIYTAVVEIIFGPVKNTSIFKFISLSQKRPINFLLNHLEMVAVYIFGKSSYFFRNRGGGMSLIFKDVLEFCGLHLRSAVETSIGTKSEK